MGAPTLLLDLNGTLLSSCQRKRFGLEALTGSSSRHLYDAEVEVRHSESYIEKLAVRLRPGVAWFLQQMSECFQIVIFSHSVEAYVEAMVALLDPDQRYVSRHLSRDSCTGKLKDVTAHDFGVDLRRLVWLDDSVESFESWPSNGILVPSFNVEHLDTLGMDPGKDTTLVELAPVLKAASERGDVREVIELWNANKCRVINGVVHQALPRRPADQGKATLVLDLDGTLVSASDARLCKDRAGWYDFQVVVKHSASYSETVAVKKRPGLDEFLQQLAGCYEIVIFSYAAKPYVDAIVDVIDPLGELISHRLAYGWCPDGVKDLDSPAFGRDLSRVVWLDDSPQPFRKQPHNGLVVPFFKPGCTDDTVLSGLLPFLKTLAELPDVRPRITRRKSSCFNLVVQALAGWLWPSYTS